MQGLQLPRVPAPGVNAVTTDDVARAAAVCHAKFAASSSDKALGGPGIPADELSTDLIHAVRTFEAFRTVDAGNSDGPVVGPGILQAVREAVREAVQPLQQTVEGLQQTVEGLQQTVEGLQQTVEGLQRTCMATHNMAARTHNGANSLLADYQLQPLFSEQHPNQTPDVFPATLSDIEHLTGVQLDQLSAFYGKPFGGATVPERRHAFKRFITRGA